MVKRILDRLAGPGREEANALARSVARLAEAQREHAHATRAQLAELTGLIAQCARSKDANEILHAIRETSALVARGLPEGTADPRGEIALTEFLDAIARGTRPIVVGPWTGEVGFELLYWAPFVAWFVERWAIDPARLVVVSRGGTAGWYTLPDARYVDIFSLMSPADFRAGTDQDAHKQRHVSAFDESILTDIQGRLGLTDAASLHPRRMYRLFAPYWSGDAGPALVDRFTIHRRIAALDDPATEGLPAEFVAVRFYFSDAFPDTPSNRDFAQRTIGALSAHVPVVLLDPGLQVDDHTDTTATGSPRITTIAGRFPPERNLAAQTAVIARARAFVGTYGGYSYLAPLCGVPAIAFYSEHDFKLHHLAMAQRVFETLGGPSVTIIATAGAPLIHHATSTS